jgi:hypothetical protein
MPSDLKMNTCDLKSIIKKETSARWQNQWEQTISPRWESIKVFNRRAQVVIIRMRIGQTHLTHSYHMNHLEPPRCDTTLTVPHISYEHMTVGCLVLRERNMESSSSGKRRG